MSLEVIVGTILSVIVLITLFITIIVVIRSRGGVGRTRSNRLRWSFPWKWIFGGLMLGVILGVGWWWVNRPPPSYIVVAPPAPRWSRAVGARFGIRYHSDYRINVMSDDGKVIPGGVGPPTKWLKFQSREGVPVNVTVYP